MSIIIATCVSDCRWLNLLVSKGTELQRILPDLYTLNARGEVDFNIEYFISEDGESWS